MRRRNWFVLTAAAVMLASCGPQGSGTPTSNAYIVATTSTMQHGEPDGIEILGLNGTIYTKQGFQPRMRPYIGNAGVPLQAVAQVVGGAVYYIDGYGAVRELLPSGAV